MFMGPEILCFFFFIFLFSFFFFCGTPVFEETRVPVDALIDFLESGDTIEDFPRILSGVSRGTVFAFLEEASQALVAKIA